MTTATRTERDAFGDIEVPAGALWGAQTQRSLAHFHISIERMPDALLHALARVKRSAALVNGELGLLDAERAQARAPVPAAKSKPKRQVAARRRN